MYDHDRIRELLPLAASGDISPDDMRRLRNHLASCPTCRLAQEDFIALGEALRVIPTPQPHAELLMRVRNMAHSRLQKNLAGRSDAAVLAPLVVASWISAMVTWPLLRAAVTWLFSGRQVPGDGFGAALAGYSILGLLFACASLWAVVRCARVPWRTR